MFLVIIVVLLLVISSSYVVITNLGDSNDSEITSYKDDPDYIDAVAGTNYPVAVLVTSKNAIAIELYNDRAPKTCENFIKLVNDGFYDGMIFHRISNGFMIQAGKEFPDGSQSQSPYGNIDFEGPNEGNDIPHSDGAISMASTAPGVGGSAEFFICDGAQSFLDGSYAAFGKVIYGIETVRDIADEPNDGRYEPNPGGGKPNIDVVINSIKMVK
jgi:cyclophilin family peptidyl-prolyl cis-trans isomerase